MTNIHINEIPEDPEADGVVPETPWTKGDGVVVTVKNVFRTIDGDGTVAFHVNGVEGCFFLPLATFKTRYTLVDENARPELTFNGRNLGKSWFGRNPAHIPRPPKFRSGWFMNESFTIDRTKRRSSSDPLLIGIAGQARSGKDEVGHRLSERLRPSEKYTFDAADWSTASFAKPIKQMLNAIGIACTDESKADIVPWLGVSERKVMQAIGTDGARSVDPDFWVKRFAATHAGKKRIVTDVRFENEADYVRKHGVLIHLTGRGGLEGEEATHVSENRLSFKLGDLVLDNSRDLDWLQAQIDSLDLTRVLDE